MYAGWPIGSAFAITAATRLASAAAASIDTPGLRRAYAKYAAPAFSAGSSASHRSVPVPVPPMFATGRRNVSGITPVTE